MDMYAVTDTVLLCAALSVFLYRRNVTASFLFFEWVLSIILATSMYKLSVDTVFRFVAGPLVPIALFLIFSLYLKIKPIKQLLYTYIAFWCVSFANYLSYFLKKEQVNGLLIIDFEGLSRDTYFAFTVTIMLIQLYIAFKLDKRGGISRNNSNNLISHKHSCNAKVAERVF